MGTSIEVLLIKIKKLVDELNSKKANSLNLNTLVDLHDFLKFSEWEYDDLLKVAQRHINLLAEFPDKEIKNQLDLNFVEAFTNSQHDLSEVSFQPLINGLSKTKDPSFISMVIHFLSGTGSKEYLPLVNKYLNYPNEILRQRANEAIKYLKY